GSTQAQSAGWHDTSVESSRTRSKSAAGRLLSSILSPCALRNLRDRPTMRITLCQVFYYLSRVLIQDTELLRRPKIRGDHEHPGTAYAECVLDLAKVTVYKTNVGKRLQPPPPPPPDPKSRKAEKRSPEKELVSALLARVEDSRDLMQVVLTLPKAHVRVL